MSRIVFAEGAAPDLPGANKVVLYAKTNGKLYSKDDAGIECAISQDIWGISHQIGDGISAITTGYKGAVQIPFGCTIQRVDLFSTVSGSTVISILKDTLSNLPLTGADNICGSDKPSLSSARTSTKVTFSGWTQNIAEKDYLGFNVDSTSGTITSLLVSVSGKKE